MILRFLHLVQHPASLSELDSFGTEVRVWKSPAAHQSTANTTDSLKPRTGDSNDSPREPMTRGLEMNNSIDSMRKPIGNRENVTDNANTARS